MGQLQTIIEFGTSKIICLSGELLEDGNIQVEGVGVKEYPGIKNGDWVDVSRVLNSLEAAVGAAEGELKKSVRSAIIGIPACFTSVVIDNVDGVLKERSVTEELVDELIDTILPEPEDDWEIIDTRIVYCTDDRENVYANIPIGVRTKTLAVCVANTLAYTPFIEDVEAMLEELKIKPEEYIPESIAQAMYLIPEPVRDSAAILVDVGYNDTAVSLIYGDAVFMQNIMFQGGGNIAKDIEGALNVDPILAENLKRSYVYGMDCSDDMVLYAKDKDKKMCGFPQTTVKKIVEARTLEIAEAIKQSIEKFKGFVLDNTPVYLTGGGFLMQSGCIPVLESVLNRKIYPTKINNIKLQSPVYNTALSLLDNAENENYYLHGGANRQSLFGKIANAFFTKK